MGLAEGDVTLTDPERDEYTAVEEVDVVETEEDAAEARAIDEEVVDAVVALLEETVVDVFVAVDPVDALEVVVEDALTARPALCIRAITTPRWSSPTARPARADPELLLSDPWR
jgi:hypothetical protein